MNPSSMDTGEKKRDEHLKSADFFDIEKNKKITFISDSFENPGKITPIIFRVILLLRGLPGK